MKIKLCPQCGKQNDVNAWSCVDCGATLSMNTIVEVGDLASSQIAVAGKGVLSGVSPFFQDDLAELIKDHTRSSETIVKGYDICKPSILPPFKFGYLVITSNQIFCTCFNSDLNINVIGGAHPKRPWLARSLGSFIDGSSSGFKLAQWSDHHFVNRPSYALTEPEKKSREATSFQLSSLYSVELANDIYLNMKFRPDTGDNLVDLSVTFYFNDEAYEIYSLLTKK